MVDQKFDDLQTLAAIDSCRPDSADASSPEMHQLTAQLARDDKARSVYAQVQRLDARLVQACADVPVPGDLSQRLKSQFLSEVQLEQPAEVAAAVVAPVTAATVTIAADSHASLADPPMSRRRMIASTLAVAASLLLAVGTGWWFQTGAPKGADVYAQVDNWYEQLSDKWQPMSSAPAGVPFPTSVVVSPREWQPARFVARKAVAFNLALPGGKAATLFVAQLALPGLPSSPPASPPSTTGGRSVAAWQSGGFLYGLVIEGDQGRYRSFVQPNTGTLALAR